MPRQVSSPLKRFGELLMTLCALFETNPSELARRAGLAQATVTESIQADVESRPTLTTTQRLWETFMEMAREAKLEEALLLLDIEECFFNSAGFSSEQQKQRAIACIPALKRMIDIKAEIVRKDQMMVQLEKENTALKREKEARLQQLRAHPWYSDGGTNGAKK